MNTYRVVLALPEDELLKELNATKVDLLSMETIGCLRDYGQVISTGVVFDEEDEL